MLVGFNAYQSPEFKSVLLFYNLRRHCQI